jgi:hypothetical protein
LRPLTFPEEIMKKIIALATAAVCAGVLALPLATVPAAAQSFSFGWGVNAGPGWNRWDGPRWYPDRNHYPRRHYPRRSGISIDLGPVDINVRGSRGWSSHVARCEARFRSYNPRTDMYLGYDGEYHRCRL